MKVVRVKRSSCDPGLELLRVDDSARWILLLFSERLLFCVTCSFSFVRFVRFVRFAF